MTYCIRGSHIALEDDEGNRLPTVSLAKTSLSACAAVIEYAKCRCSSRTISHLTYAGVPLRRCVILK